MTAIATLPDLRPSLLLDFANSGRVDPRIQSTRASSATCFGPDGKLRTVAANVPRIDYDPVTGACKGLLIEEARTNLLTYSEQFNNAAWVKLRSSVTPNAITAPDGTLTADKLVEDTTASNTHQFTSASYAATGITLTASIYAKAAERSRVRIQTSNLLSGSAFATFNLSDGSTRDVGSSTGDYTDVSVTCTSVGNGWYRCTLTATKGSENTINAVIVQIDNGTTPGYTGDGTSGIYLWGAQLEAGPFPTSYIPTTTAQVTRATDGASMTGANFSSWYRQDEGTFVVDATVGLDLVSTVIISANSSSNINVIEIVAANQVGIGPYGNVNAGGVSQAVMPDGYIVANTAYRAAIAYRENDFAFSRDGRAAVTDSSGTISTVERLDIGARVGLANIFNGHIKRIAYYPKRLTNAQLQRLTA